MHQKTFLLKLRDSLFNVQGCRKQENQDLSESIQNLNHRFCIFSNRIAILIKIVCNPNFEANQLKIAILTKLTIIDTGLYINYIFLEGI